MFTYRFIGDGEFGFYIHDSRFRRKREWKMYDLFYKLAARVSAIFVHVGTLVLGTESGLFNKPFNSTLKSVSSKKAYI